MTLQLKWKHQFQFAGYYAALAKGFYSAAGLDVTLLEGGPAVDVETAVRQGRAQFGVGTSNLLLSSRAEVPAVILAVIFQHAPDILLTRREIGAGGLRALAGKRLMDAPNSAPIAAMLAREGIDYNRLPRVAHTGSPHELIAGRGDMMIAYSTNEPYVFEREGLPYLAFTPRTMGVDFYGDNLFTTRQFVQQHPATVEAFRQASLQGWRYAMEHPEEIAALIRARYSPAQKLEKLMFEANEMRQLMQPDIVEIGHMNPERWHRIAGFYAALGMLAPDTIQWDAILYRPPAAGFPPWVVWGAWGGAFALVLLSAIALRFAQLNRRLAALQRELAEQATRDGLTGVFNRRYLEEALVREHALAERNGLPISVLLIDVDHFKQINDRFGHQAGDEVLRWVARVLRDGTRTEDIVCRYGGEEFLVLLPGTSSRVAAKRAEVLRSRFRAMAVAHGGQDVGTVTASIGVATRAPGGVALGELIAHADAAMYQAKKGGRDQVVVYPHNAASGACSQSPA